ncbi:MAG: RNA polymerase sigma factor [Planctomycetota bacterium]
MSATPANRPAAVQAPLRVLEGGPSDEVLERRWREGCEAAFSELFRRHYPGVVAYARRFVADVPAAEDVVQQAFLNVLQRQDGRGRFKSLIYTVTRNLALNELRRRGRRYVPQAGLEAELEPQAPPAPPLAALIVDEEQAALAAAMRALPEPEREAFALKETRGLTYAEVGEVMGLHPDAVRRRVRKAFALLRDLCTPRPSPGEEPAT